MGTYWIRALGGCLAVAGLMLAAPAAQATTYYNLTNLNADGTANAALNNATINGGMFTSDVSSEIVGTGVLQPFVRVQQTGNGNCQPTPCIESGYNTDGTKQFETKDKGGSNWDHSLLLAIVSTVTKKDANGVDTLYRVFVLDINESNSSAGDQFLSLDKLKIYTGSVGNLDKYTESYPDATPGAPDALTSQNGSIQAKKVYDIDFDKNNVNTDSTLALNYDLNSGSGKGIDMIAYIPDAVFKDANGNYSNPYVYLYSSFGATGTLQANGNTKDNLNGSDPPPGVLPAGNYAQSAGFEEWATRKGNRAPEPMSSSLFLVGLAALAYTQRKRLSPARVAL